MKQGHKQVRLHKNLAVAVVNCLEAVFNQGKQADKVIAKMLKSNKYFVAEDSLFQPRIDGNPELYDMIRRRLGETEHGTTTE